jgi:hypothetical protein
MKSKKGQITEHMVEFAFAVVILMVFWLFIKVLIYFPGIGLDIEGLTLSMDETTISRACDVDLVNFLRFEDPELKLTFAELFALAHKDSSLEQNVSQKAEAYFSTHYRRGDSRFQDWSLEVVDELNPIIEIGPGLVDPEPFDSCEAVIPKIDGGALNVELELDY